MFGFKFSSDSDSNFAKSFAYLIKNHDGFFKTKKQATTLFSLAEIRGQDEFKANFGIDLTDGQRIIFVSGSVRFADYGSKSERLITWVYVVDSVGIVAKHKCKRGYSSDGKQSWIIPEGTVCEWSRPETAVAPVFEEPVVPVEANGFIGAVGDKIATTATLVKISRYNKQRRFYGDSDVGYQATFKTEQGSVVYWGFPVDKESRNDIEVGSVVKITATVKDHSTFRNVNQTVIARPKFSVIK